MTLQNKKIDLSIIVVACSAEELLEECFTALRNSNDTLHKEIIYVDNGSTDNSLKITRECFPEVVIVESPVNLGFIRANNLAYKHVSGEYVLMLNSDAFVGQDSLQESYDFMKQNQDCGALGVRLVDRQGNMQPSARYFPTPWNIFLCKFGIQNNDIPFLKGIDDLEKDHKQVFECDWVPGCFLLTTKEIIDDLGFFLREDFFMYFDDVDLCLRIKQKNWKVYYIPNDVIHLGGANSAKLTEITDKGKLIEKYNVEAEIIHFRKNYNLLVAFMDYFFSFLAELLKILMKMIFWSKKGTISQHLKRIRLISSIAFKTQFGKKSIH